MCAERNAIFQAIAKGRAKLQALVVVTPTRRPTPPCGACRQVLNEFSPEAEVFIFGENNISQRFKMSELLPAAFGPLNMS
jgi:cytidine deaminase